MRKTQEDEDEGMENILDELKIEEAKESEVFEDREDFIDEVIFL
jgi:hypothetical protein